MYRDLKIRGGAQIQVQSWQNLIRKKACFASEAFGVSVKWSRIVIVGLVLPTSTQDSTLALFVGIPISTDLCKVGA